MMHLRTNTEIAHLIIATNLDPHTNSRKSVPPSRCIEITPQHHSCCCTYVKKQIYSHTKNRLRGLYVLRNMSINCLNELVFSNNSILVLLIIISINFTNCSIPTSQTTFWKHNKTNINNTISCFIVCAGCNAGSNCNIALCTTTNNYIFVSSPIHLLTFLLFLE